MSTNWTVRIIAVVLAGILFWAFGGRSKGSRQQAKLKSLPTYAQDFTTPQGAILCLEDAYRKHDLEAAVAAKDFGIEARLMLQNLNGKSNLAADKEVHSEATKTLELSFRAYTKKDWPDFNGIESYFTDQAPHSPGIVVITEVCRFPDGGVSEQKLLVAETPKGWRVLNVVEK